jgi:Tripartite tricarboxylate transporter TctB family
MRPCCCDQVKRREHILRPLKHAMRFPRLRNDQLSGLMLLALALFVGWQNRSYPMGTLQEPGAGYTPLLIAGFLGIIGLLIALNGKSSPPLAAMSWPEAPRAMMILAACALATYALEHLGYRLSIAALLVFFLGVMERKSPLVVVLVAAGFAWLSYYFIATLLRVPLPLGSWGW